MGERRKERERFADVGRRILNWAAHSKEQVLNQDSNRNMSSSKKKSRRRFLNTVLGVGVVGWVGGVLYPVLSFLNPPEQPEPNVRSVVATAVDGMSPNSGQIIKFGRKPVILIRLDSGEYRAFSAICTHLDCTVQYRTDFKHIWCACHNGHYDLRGKNIAGPPPRPLMPYDVTIVDDEVVVSAPSAA